MEAPDIEKIKDLLANKGYKYLDDGKNYHLNIIGIRSCNPEPNTFDDLLVLLYNDETGQRYKYMACTTKPGIFYLIHPDNPNGVAIIVPGQYLGLFEKGMHKNEYPCLKQSGTLKVYRDNDRNGKFDYSKECDAPPSCGLEIHHACNNFASIEVNNWSAGCQVVADPESFKVFMQLVDKSIAIRGNKFSYTLINEVDL